jgi:hypothetical protein
LQAPLNRIMELPDELLLEICEYLQPARYEHEAALPELLTLRPSRVAAHDAAAAVKKTSRGFLELMTRTARVVNGNLYSSYAEFAAEAHPYAEVFQADVDYRAKWVNDDVLGLLHTVMPRLRAVELVGTYSQNRVTLRGVRALMESYRATSWAWPSSSSTRARRATMTSASSAIERRRASRSRSVRMPSHRASASSSTSTPLLSRSRWPYGITRRSPTWTRRPCRWDTFRDPLPGPTDDCCS